MVRLRIASLLVVVSLIAAGCSASAAIDPASTASSDSGNDVTLQADSASEAELSSEAVYAAIENSVVFVLAPDGQSSGSGIVIEDGWILTNAHVVDRHTEMRIGRSDGEDLGLYEVHAVDWIFDLALVGPVDDASLVPMQRGVSADLSLGSRVLLVGFPDEDSAAPTPTLTEGILSRRRFVALGDFPFLQVDATIAPGQSGGALVNGNGELVGISGLEFGQGEFGMAFASDPMWPRIVDLIAIPGPALPSGSADFELTDQIGPLRNFGFTMEVDESGSVDMLVSSNADVWVDVQTLGGITVSQAEESTDPFRVSGFDGQLYVDELAEGGEDVIATLEPGTYQVVIGSFSLDLVDVEVSASNPLRRFADIEENRELPVGVVVEGDFDWIRDTDSWELELAAGDDVSVTADGISDTVLVVRLGDEVIATSDDEGLGIFGTGSRVDFVADQDGVYSVEVGTYDQTRWGYLIQATVS